MGSRDQGLIGMSPREAGIGAGSCSLDSSIADLRLKKQTPEDQGEQIGHLSPSPNVSTNGSLSASDLEALSSTFTEEELKRIISCDKLAGTAASNPRRAKRILANRRSGARSKERRLKHKDDLELNVRALEAQIHTLSTKVKEAERGNADVRNENNDLRLRLEAMYQEAELKDALNATLAAEVQQMRILTANEGDEAPLSV